MKPTKMLRNISLKRLLKFSSSSSSLVVPLPIQTPFNQQLTSNLKNLKQLTTTSNDHHHYCNFLAHAINTLTSTHDLARESLSKSTSLEAIERYLEDNIDLLDLCNGLAERSDNICKYVDSLRSALHLLENTSNNPSSITMSRANKLLDSCKSMEKLSSRTTPSLKKSSSSLSSPKKNEIYERSFELGEVLEGSSFVTSTICEILDAALSFKVVKQQHCTRGTTTLYTWLYTLQELRNGFKKEAKKSVICDLQKGVQELKCHHQNNRDFGELRVIVEELKKNCDEIDSGIRSIEGKLKELYRFLLSIRVALMGKLSSMA